MAIYKAKIPTSIADVGDGARVYLVPHDESNLDNAIELTNESGGDTWWVSATQTTSDVLGSYDLWVDNGGGGGAVVTSQEEALDIWFGNESIKTHIDDANPHSGSASTSSLTTHTGAKNNPHEVTVAQIENESDVTLATIDDDADGTDSADSTVTWSVGQLFSKFGNMDFVGFSFIEDAGNVTQALKYLAYQVQNNLQGITGGTNVFNRRTLYTDSTVATTGTASAAIERTETDTTNTVKVRLPYVKKNGDTQIVVTCQRKASNVDTPEGLLEVGTLSNSYDYGEPAPGGVPSYTTHSWSVNVTSLTNDTLYEVTLGLYSRDGTSTAYMKNIIIDVI